LSEFNNKGCVLVKDFLDEQAIKIISQYLENRIKRGNWESLETSDPLRSPSKYAYYADPLIEVLLQSSIDRVKEVVGEEIVPTYSYVRVYQEGEALAPHTDRESCEISVTVNVATKGPDSPIYMQYEHNDPVKYLLNPGDAVVYKGCEAMHWRRTLQQGQLEVQFMLHYVRVNGPYSGFAKDTRTDFGMAAVPFNEEIQ